MSLGPRAGSDTSLSEAGSATLQMAAPLLTESVSDASMLSATGSSLGSSSDYLSGSGVTAAPAATGDSSAGGVSGAGGAAAGAGADAGAGAARVPRKRSRDGAELLRRPQVFPRIILGSQSKWRRGVMAELGIPCECTAADIDEKAVRHPDPMQLPVEVAKAKARKLLEEVDRSEPGYLVTGDQVVVYDGVVREKPESLAQAKEFIASYTRAPAVTVAAIVVTDLQTGRSFEGTDVAKVYLSPELPDAAIDAAIAGGEGDCMSCCGALCVEDPALKAYVAKMEGPLDSVYGMPKDLLMALLRKAKAAKA